MNKKLFFDQVPQSTQSGQLIPTNAELYNPGSWLKDGKSPTEIILATAILVSEIAILVSSIATLIHGDSHAEIILATAILMSAIAGLLNVLKQR
jgi:hypothetical protein